MHHVQDNPARPRNPPSATRRDDIVAAARELYEQRGLAKTTVRDVTERVGVTRSLFYHYFSDKGALTEAVLDTYVDDFLEAARYWNEQRHPGDIEGALKSAVGLIRLMVFEHDSFRLSLATHENASLYLAFLNRAADTMATYMLQSTVPDYEKLHEVDIHHVYETFYVLITGLVGYLRSHPDADDELIADIIAQTLHMERGVFTFDADASTSPRHAASDSNPFSAQEAAGGKPAQP